MSELSPLVSAFLSSAGWKGSPEGASVPASVASADELASHVISTFCGLNVGTVGQGVENAACNVHFNTHPRPGVSRVVEAWSAEVGELAAFATAHNDHIILFVGTNGNYYAFTDPDDELYSIGQTFGEAMDCMLLGFDYGPPIRRGV